MFSIDHASSITLYEQLMRQFRDRLDSGALIAGTKLPTVRQLAADLEVAPYTVARVYRALEADGFVETLGRNGTIVRATSQTASQLLQLAASQYASRARELGVGSEAAIGYISSAFEA
jgi:DNA-binding transcriptional regulator YhcF (GntR family)